MASKKGMTLSWNCEPVKHGNYTDLGNYVIDLGEFSEADIDIGVEYNNKNQDSWPKTACTAVVKKNSKAEVIVGRNQDMEVSNYPGYISHLNGKYKAVGFFYDNKGKFTYEEYKAGVDMPGDYRCGIAGCCTDAFNEKGLYIQTNMRTGYGVKNSGTNPGKKRVGEISVVSLAAANCATVQDVIAFINTLDVYSMGDPDCPATWSFAFLAADAAGEYGIIEFADNKVFYTPYAPGHANAFVALPLITKDPFGAGYGRLEAGMRYLPKAEDEYDMMKAIGLAGWSREITDCRYSHLDANGHAVFCDEFGAPSIDYRTELTGNFGVDDEGNVIDEGEEDAISGFLGYYAPAVKDQYDQLKTMYLMQYHINATKEYVLDDKNFEKVKDVYIKNLEKHNAFNLLEKYFNGDEKGLRDDGTIYTTGMRFGVNCAKKHLVLRYFEKEDVTLEYQW